MNQAGPLRVVVAGQGYVGLPLAMRSVDVGYDVVGLEVSTDRVKRLAAGESFVEDVPAKQVRAALDSGRYQVSDDPGLCAGFDVAVITVPTPLSEGVPDLSCNRDARTVPHTGRPRRAGVDDVPGDHTGTAGPGTGGGLRAGGGR